MGENTTQGFIMIHVSIDDGRRGSDPELILSVQAEDSEMRTNQRPDFIHLSNHSPDREELVLYPDQWDDRVSLAER